MDIRFAVRLVPIILLLIAAVTACGCIIVRDSPAPGCIKYIGIPTMGGCSGKTAIINLNIEPKPECIKIEVNNCNGGVLEISNRCTVPLVIGGISIAPQELHASLDIESNKDGRCTLIRTSTNFSRYIPAANEKIDLSGKLGEQAIRVSFTKTAKLCD
jgi:hypothetical protein